MKLKKKDRKAKINRRNFSPPGEHENQTRLVARVQEIAAPLCDAEGIELVHVEYVREPEGRKLRLYIDKPGGIKLDDCVMIGRELGTLLDIHITDDFGAYSLEVSSPGTRRPLVKPADFERFKDSAVKITTSSAINGQKNFKGTLVDGPPGFITLNVNGKAVQIPFQEISRARLNPS